MLDAETPDVPTDDELPPDMDQAAQDTADDDAPYEEDAAQDGVDLGEGVSLIDDEPSQVTSLRDSVAELQARLRTVSAAYQRQSEEVQATRARLERQGALDLERRRGEVVANLFEPLQNLRRSVAAMRKAGIDQHLADGIIMVEHQFMDAFQRLGLEEVPGKGAKFDPTLHEAISVFPVTDPALDDTVIEVFSAGYRIGNRLIQPARVVIGQLADDAGEA